MGWTVLYIAFGVVALWLLAEVLLQYKARLRWRLLAFTGFLGVVAGVLVPSVVVIVIGALAFGVGQTFVTLSFRRGFSRGWALRRGAADDGDGPGGAGAGPGGQAGSAGATGSTRSTRSAAGNSRAAGGRAGRRRKGGERPPAPAAPSPTASDLTLPASGPDALPTLGGEAAGAPAMSAGLGGAPDLTHGVPPQPTAEQPHLMGHEAPAATDFGQYGGQPAQGGQYGGGFDYGQAQGQYASYSDPYIGNRPPSYETYDAYGQQQSYPHQQQYGVGAYSAGAYAPQQYDTDTPPGGVWVPQQRDTDAAPGTTPAAPPAPHAPHEQNPPYGQGQGYDEQRYRY
ncbi:hypothetical protein [Streptomyces abikoensis]|uniref:hypothetical protein n=1 Tax=Streptomyces abikoensis TaxID=97398 RepID=UPI001672838C|nr:hypothetical protein [Streptomyces abikoensis]GGP69350.1 hypothetical protein GCM10010214_49940 [Streptomyces abikoensis]